MKPRLNTRKIKAPSSDHRHQQYVKRVQLDFNPAEHLGDDEKRFFAALSKYIDLSVQETYSIITKGRMRVMPDKDDENAARFHIGVMLENSIGGIAGYPFLLELKEHVKADVAAHELSEQAASEITTFVASFLDLSDATASLKAMTTDSQKTREAVERAKKAPMKEFYVWMSGVLENMRTAVQRESISDEAKEYINAQLDAHASELKGLEDISRILKRQNLLKYWCEGKFTHGALTLTKDNEARNFGRGLAASIKTFLSMSGQYHKDNADGSVDALVDKAVAAFVTRVQAYEKPMVERQQELDRRRQEALEDRRKQKEQDAVEATKRETELAVERAVTAAKEYREFHLNRQPYVLSGNAGAILSSLSHHANTAAAVAPAAKILHNTIASLRDELDIRDPAAKELGDLLLSTPNIYNVAKALGASSAIKHLTASAPPNWRGNAKQLRELYKSSSAVAGTVNKLLENEEGVLMLATLVRSEERCRNYAQFLINQGKQQPEGAPDMVKVRADLADEIRQILEGKAVSEVPDSAVPASRANGAAVKESWRAIMGSDFSAEPVDDKHVRISSAHYPDMHIIVKSGYSDMRFTQELNGLRNDCNYHDASLNLIRQLCGECGFSFTQHKDGSHITHPEYNINIPLSGSELEQMTILLDAKEQFEARYFDQQTLLDQAKRAGIAIDYVNHGSNAIALTPPKGAAITIAPRGYLSRDDATAVQHMIDGLVHATSPVGAADELEAAAKSPAARITFAPPAGHHIIVADAALFKVLAARRDGVNTWLDLVEQTAKLPNVTIIVPAVVADWELQGRIHSYDKDGNRTGFKQADPRFAVAGHPLQREARVVSKFLQSASRGSIDKNGHVQIEPGENPHIIIMDTEGDRELYARIGAFRKLPPRQMIDRLSNEIHHHGEGDKAISRIVKELRYETPITIVSDDITYLKEAPHTSPQGLAVNHMSVGAYLRAELENRENALRMALKEQSPITLEKIQRDANAFLNNTAIMTGIDVRRLFPYETVGKNALGYPGRPQRLTHIIAKGIGQAQEGGNGNAGAGAHSNNGGTWAAKRPPVSPPSASPITPDGVHREGENGHAPSL